MRPTSIVVLREKSTSVGNNIIKLRINLFPSLRHFRLVSFENNWKSNAEILNTKRENKITHIQHGKQTRTSYVNQFYSMKRPINGTRLAPSIPISYQLTLAIRVRKVRYSFSATPRRIVFISGIPEPILCGATMCTKPALKRIRHIGKETHAKYWRAG